MVRSSIKLVCGFLDVLSYFQLVCVDGQGLDNNVFNAHFKIIQFPIKSLVIVHPDDSVLLRQQAGL